MAEDAVMDAFVQAQRQWSRISSYDNPPAWIRRAAINRLSNRRRDLRRRLRLFEGTLPPPAVSLPESAGAGTAALLKGLPAQQRIAAALYYLEDLPVAEVALAMHVSESTVKTHLRRAREHLSSLLEVSDR